LAFIYFRERHFGFYFWNVFSWPTIKNLLVNFQDVKAAERNAYVTPVFMEAGKLNSISCGRKYSQGDKQRAYR